MNIETKKVQDVLVVKPAEKRLDAKVAVSFKEAMVEFINTGSTLIVLDLSGVDFVDSSGLGAIVSSLKVLGRKGDIVIAGVGTSVLQMFSLTRMDKVFKMFPTQEEALQALSR
ncbi:MAG: STAS domain-containing protein [Bacteroidota bacterium]